MSDATDARKDDLAARLLSELEKPVIPEGLAARITARATAVPQIAAAGGVETRAPKAAMPPLESASVLIMPVKGGTRAAASRGRVYAAASAAAAVLISVGLISVGLLAGGHDSAGETPMITEADSAERAPVPSAVEDGEKLAEARPRQTRVEAPAPKRPLRPAPAMTLPVVLTPPSTELALDAEPSDIAPAVTAPQAEKLVQTVPQSVPQGGGSAISVYGPPAPSGLGIAGPVPGQQSPPGDAVSPPRGPRGTPLGPPPSNLPGSSLPRGPAPRL